MSSRRRAGIKVLVALAALFAGAAAADAQSVAMSGNASYHQGDLPSAAPTVTVTCAAGFWNSVNHIRLIIPSGVNMTWDTTIASLSVTGTAQSAGHIAANPTFSFANGNRTIIITVSSTFAAGNQAIISGLRVANFGAPSSSVLAASYDASNTVDGSSVFSGNTLTIVGNPTVSSGSNQIVSPPGPVTANNIVITDAGTPGIWASTDLRITIPAGLNMTWNTGVTTVGIAMLSGAGSVSTTLFAYEDGNKTAVLNVTGDFSSGASVRVTGLQFSGIGADSGPFPLTVTTNGNAASRVSGNQGTDAFTKQIVGTPSISSAAGQVFTKGDPSTAAQTITITESPGTPKIGTAADLQIVIPAALAMTWDTTMPAGSITVTGTAQTAGHIAANPTFSFANGNQTLIVTVTSAFASNQTAILSGLRFANFNAQSPASRLTLDVNGDGSLISTDNQTIAIGAPTISSIANQVFQVGDPPTAASTITITDGTPARITAANAIRIKIPAGFNMQFDTTRTTTGSGLVFGGTGLVHAAQTITYLGTQTAIVNLLTDFTAGQTLTIAGLRFQNFSGPSTPNRLQLEVNNLGTNCNLDAFIIAIGGLPSISSASNQVFTVNDPSTAAAQITITDANGFPSITAAKGITIKIPAGFPMQWNTTIQNAPPLVFGGTGAGFLTANPKVTYPDSKTALIHVQTDFPNPGLTVTVSGLQFTTFSAAAPPASLSLFVDPLGSGVNDNHTIGIGRPTIALSASQTFGTTDPSTVLNTVTITEDAVVPRLTAAKGIRIQIPNPPLLMSWDTTVHQISDGLSFGGTGAGHVSAGPVIVTYPTATTALIALATDFNPGETLTIDGLKVTGFGGVSGPNPLGLNVSNLGTLCSTSAQTLAIGARPQLLSVVTADTNGNGSLDHLILTYDKPINAATSSATTGLGFSVVAPNYTIGSASVVGAVVTLSLVERGVPDTGARPSVVYDPMVGNLQDLSGLTTNSAGPVLAADGAAPVAMSITQTDGNANGHLETVTITFSETLKTGQEDPADWKLIDADGSTDLLQGLSSMLISGSTVTFNLADVSGTTGTPRYLYAPNGNLLKIQDPTGNVAVQQTNVLPPTIVCTPDSVVPPSKVILDASKSTDPNGQPLTFSWTPQGGSPALTNGNTATAFFLGTTAGTFTYTVTVSNFLVSATKNVHITIIDVPPGADAGANQTATPDPSGFFLLVALASLDANGTSPNFNWTQLSGVGGAMFFGNSSVAEISPIPSPSTTAPANNILVFQVAVDDTVNTSTALTTVRLNGGTVGSPIYAPTAIAGPDQVVYVGDTVTLDGTSSLNPASVQGGVLTYKWTGPVATTAGAVPGTATFVPAVPGIYTFKLVVNSTHVGAPPFCLDSLPATVRILVQSPGNQAPVAAAHRLLPTGDITIGDDVVLDGTGSEDPEGVAVTYAWLQTAGPDVVLNNPSSIRPSFTPVIAATYTFQLTVSDGINKSFPDSVSLTVRSSTAVATYTASLSYGTGINPVTGRSPLAPFNLNCNVSDANQLYYLYLEQTGGPAATITSSQAEGQLLCCGSSLVSPPAAFPGTPYAITPSAAGTYSFRLQATSTPDLVRAYATITVIVDSGLETVPTALAASLPSSVMTGQTVTLDSTGSTGSSLRPYWVQLEGPPVKLSDPYSTNPTFTPVAAGQYTFGLTVSDNVAQSPQAFTVVTVTQSPAAASSGGGGGGGCGFLGLEGILLLPLFWLASALRSRLPAKRT